MTPTEPGYYWATAATGKRAVVQVIFVGEQGLLKAVAGTFVLQLDYFSDWSEKLVDPKEREAVGLGLC